MATAKHRAIDRLRRDARLERKQEEIGRELEAARKLATAVTESSGDFGDDLLRLVFIACHPVLSTEARVALTLRLLGGLSTDEIARAFLVPESTVAQRIVRAKRTLTAAHVPFEVPVASDLGARLASALEVIYLVFNEGYSATAGDDWMRPALCLDALRLGRLVADLLPREPETHGLVALMEIQASRTKARVGPAGEPILLLDQNRGQWDQLLIRRGLAALERAEALGGALGPYALQAAIAACHARARTAEETDWAQIAALYDALAQLAHSPVVELNRAVAIVKKASLLGAIALLCACTASTAPPAASVSESPTVTAERSATPTPISTPSPTATPRPDPPVAATDPDALAVQIVAAEHAVRDGGVTGADLAWFGHLQQLTYRKLAARPEWRDAVLAALPSDIRATATANADATADLRATVVPGPDLPKTWRIVDPAPRDGLARY